MKSLPINVHPKAADINRRVERTLNRLVRGYDGLMEKLHLGGRKGKNTYSKCAQEHAEAVSNPLVSINHANHYLSRGADLPSIPGIHPSAFHIWASAAIWPSP